MKTCVVSVDVEQDLGQNSGDSESFRGVESLDRILEVFNEFELRASLFVTGEVLEKYPGLAEKWSLRHEIACHGYYHVPLYELSIAEREKQLEDCCRVQRRILARDPVGFRAVMNTIDNAQMRLLEHAGLTYDSSVVPSYVPFRKYVGYKGKAPSQPYHPSHNNYREKGGLSILEIPESPLVFGIPLKGTWIRVLGPSLYRVLLTLKKPEFVALSLHSWDVVAYKGGCSQNTGQTFVKYLESILKMLIKDYTLMAAEEIVSVRDNGRRV